MEEENNNNNTDYSFEIDMNNLNNIIGMYNYNTLSNSLNETNSPNPINSSFNYIYQYDINNTNQLFSNTSPIYVEEVKDMKKKLVDIIKKKDFEEEEYDINNYQNKEFDDLYEKIKSFNENFKLYQQQLYDSEQILNDEINKINKNISTLNNFIKFLENLSTIDYEDIKGIIKLLNEISEKLSNTESFKIAKKNYVTEKRNINKYLHLFKLFNKLNVTNICTVCMESPVTNFIIPCGHTFCKECLEKSLQINIDQNVNIKKCPLCREYINSIKPLYFL